MTNQEIPEVTDALPIETYRNRSPEIGQLAAALCKAQGAMDVAKKGSTNPHFRNAYADLASVWDAIREPLSSNGLSIVQFPRTVKNGVEIETILLHSSGEYMGDVLWVPCLKFDAQGIGSAITYGRRYSAMSIAGIAPAATAAEKADNVGDDDGNAASHKAGLPGSAGGGTDFRPPGPRRMPTNNYLEDAKADGLVDETRAKGEMPGKPKANGGNSVKRAEWCAKAVAYFKTIPPQKELEDWWQKETEKLEIIEHAMPAEYDRLVAEFDRAIERSATKAK
jgi:hypothetical protein